MREQTPERQETVNVDPYVEHDVMPPQMDYFEKGGNNSDLETRDLPPTH